MGGRRGRFLWIWRIIGWVGKGTGTGGKKREMEEETMAEGRSHGVCLPGRTHQRILYSVICRPLRANLLPPPPPPTTTTASKKTKMPTPNPTLHQQEVQERKSQVWKPHDAEKSKSIIISYKSEGLQRNCLNTNKLKDTLTLIVV